MTSFALAIAVGCGSNSTTEQPATESDPGDEEFEAMLRELDSMGAQQDSISYIDVPEEQIHAMFENSKNEKQ